MDAAAQRPPEATELKRGVEVSNKIDKHGTLIKGTSTTASSNWFSRLSHFPVVPKRFVEGSVEVDQPQSTPNPCLTRTSNPSHLNSEVTVWASPPHDLAAVQCTSLPPYVLITDLLTQLSPQNLSCLFPPRCSRVYAESRALRRFVHMCRRSVFAHSPSRC